MRKLILIVSATLFFVVGCKSKLNVEEIISQSIETYGGKLYKNSRIQFDFRGRSYSAARSNDTYLFERTYRDSTGLVKEYINNEGTFKEINGKPIDLTKSEARRIGNSINSVIYFASLPYPLQDRAVIKKLLGETTHDSKTYSIIEITFSEEGGGDDFEDRYIYWINNETYKMDFLAYYFHVNGGGSRFRVVHNERKINGIVLTDHDNYKADKIGITDIERYLELYEKGDLKKVSEINLENPEVELL